MLAVGRSLILHELNEDAPIDHDPVAGLEAFGNIVLVAAAIAQRHMLPREAAVGFDKIHERQVFDRRARSTKPAPAIRCFPRGRESNTRTYICFLRKSPGFSTTTRTITERVSGSTSAAMLSTRAGKALRADTGLHVGCIANVDRRQIGTKNLRHDPDARKVGNGKTRRGARLQKFAGSDQLFDHGSCDRRAKHSGCAQNRPALLNIFDGLRDHVQETSACRAASRSASALTASVSA